MRAKGYEIKSDSLEDGAAKYISFRPLHRDRFVRGSVKSLGKEYTKEHIKGGYFGFEIVALGIVFMMAL